MNEALERFTEIKEKLKENLKKVEDFDFVMGSWGLEIKNGKLHVEVDGERQRIKEEDFVKIFEKHNELDDLITEVEEGRKPMDDFELEKLKKEADKTVLVCKNCHAEIHAGIHKKYANRTRNKVRL